MEVTNQVRDARTRRGLSATELAERVGVSRQTIHAIESGAYAPNTATALKLARELGVGIEDLFTLTDASPAPRARAALVGEEPYPGAPLRLCRVGGKLTATAWSPEPFVLPLADAIAATGAGEGWVEADLLDAPPDAEDRLLLAGCDPAASLLAERLRRAAGVELVTAPSSSRRALEWLEAGRIHIAGTHLGPRAKLPPGCRAFTLAEWEAGLVVAAGNPLGLRSATDLARKGVSIINREPGAGSRVLLDRELEAAGVEAASLTGYRRTASGHLAAAWAVRRGDADACIAPRVAARAFGLDFTPWTSEAYQLVVPEGALDLRSVQALLDLLQRASFRRELSALGGYDTAMTGTAGPAAS